jgi:ABC-2 type transport system permease protein
MFARASIPWFLGHELRVAWRSFGAAQKRGAVPKKRRFRISPVAGALIILAVATALGVPAALALRGVEIVPDPVIAIIVDAVILLIFSLMLSQTLVAAVDAFYQRGDLDLLLASPVSPTKILTVRALAIAVNPAMLFGALATPFLLPAAVLGHPELLGTYIVIGAMSLLATAIGLALAIVLFRVIGPRRTRTVAQVLAAVIGALFVIAAQLPNIISNNEQGANFWNEWILGLVAEGGLPAFARWPAEAILGNVAILLAIAVIAIIAFAIVAIWVGRRFAGDAAAANSADRAKRRRAPGRTRARFGGTALSATIAKEGRLLRRDPGLISQILLRVFYIIPLGFFVFTSDDLGATFNGVVVAAAIALLAGQLAGSVAWITLSAEDAPELLAASPVPIGSFWRAKLLATVGLPAILLSPVLIGLLFIDPVAGVIAIVAGAGSAISAGLINLWLQKPAKRSEFRRSWNSSFAASILELAASAVWAAAAGMAAAGLITALIPVAAAFAILGLSYRSEQTILARVTGDTV